MKCEDRRTGVFSRLKALASRAPSGDAASPRRGCANEGCPRETEPGERYCVSCGLERAMYRRDARRPAPAEAERPSGREAGRR
jgi:hypothetical protein